MTMGRLDAIGIFGSCVMRRIVIVVGMIMIMPATVFAQDAPRAGEVLTRTDGTLASFLKAQHFCPAEGKCYDLVVDQRVPAVIRVDGHWVSGIEATGKGQEVVRKRIVVLEKPDWRPEPVDPVGAP